MLMGGFEQIIIAAVMCHEDGTAYGTSIHEVATALLNGNIGPSIGALYTSLSRLEKKGYVTSVLGDPTPQRGGRAKRFYSVTSKGESALRRTVGCAMRIAERLDGRL